MPSRQQLANAIRALSMDAVQKANSGHPGMPMGMADIAEVLWRDFLIHNPNNPKWVNRDRFILSNGHGAMLQYALLHLTGYDLTIEDIKQFRQLHSRTPGHPEFGETVGIETTTGPLGQGLANAVGMAIAECALAAQFNRGGFNIVDHSTYAFVGDGCLMEGISHEVCSLAGTLGLGKLTVFYDDNNISIDGDVAGWFTDNTPERFRAYNWHVIPNVDGHDAEAIRNAIAAARANTTQPTIICCKTHIAFGAPTKQGTAESHGAPLGDKEIEAARKQLNWPHPPFEIPNEIYAAWDARKKGDELEANWQRQFIAYQKAYPELAIEFQRRIAHRLPPNWSEVSQHYIQHRQQHATNVATRKASEECLNAYGPSLPELLGGSADLTESNRTWWAGSHALTKKNLAGNYIHYGVREFGMCAIMNGIALHGGFIPYGGTFLVFTDYARNAIRLSALMKQKVIFVLTHDSIGLGEDGPTHQPVEHATMLRATPNLMVWRPGDGVETAVAWQYAIEHQGPTCLLLTRQNVEQQQRNASVLANIKRGGYVLSDCLGIPEIIIIATGSELEIAVAAAKQLTEQGRRVRVVSMPSTSVFDQQNITYKESVLPSRVIARIAIEAGAMDFWYKYVGLQGKVIGLNRFGASAPYKAIYKDVGITIDHVISAVDELIRIEIKT